MTFQYFWLKQTLNNDTLMTKLANIKNQINNFSKCTWFGTLCSMVSFYVHLNTNILFYRWRDFITWPMSYVLVLKFQWIRSQHIMGTWFSETVIFLGSFKQLCIITTQKICALVAVTMWFFIMEISKDWAYSSTNKIWSLGEVIIWLFIMGVSNDWALSQPNKI